MYRRFFLSKLQKPKWIDYIWHSKYKYMKNQLLLTSLVFILLSNFTFSQSNTTLTKTSLMIGNLDKSDFQKAPYNSWYKEEYENYSLDSNALKQIKLGSQTLLVYFGSWCSDSRREVPRFIKIMDYLNFDYNKINFVGLDREKKAPNYKKNIWDIQYVPTFIILENGIEIGRIIETPDDSLEKDLLKIFSK
jgi:thiol-disulfide isomerase/thioredoxin